MATFTLQWLSSCYKIMWPRRPKIFAIMSFKKKFAKLWDLKDGTGLLKSVEEWLIKIINFTNSMCFGNQSTESP